MNLFSTAPEWAIWTLMALLVGAALQDAVQLRISNYITAAVFVLALVTMVATGFRVDLWQNAALFALVLTVGALLFARNILGGGDVKLFAAVALWTNFATSLRLIALILVCGGILAVLILIARSAASESLAARVKTLRPRAGIPYGIAIAAGTLLTIAVVPDRPKDTPLSTVAPIPNLNR